MTPRGAISLPWGKLFPSANGSRPHNIAPTPAQLPPKGTHSTWAPNGTYVGGVVIFRFPEGARTNFCHTFQPANTLPGVATDAPKSAFVLLHNWQLEIKEKFGRFHPLCVRVCVNTHGTVTLSRISGNLSPCGVVFRFVGCNFLLKTVRWKADNGNFNFGKADVGGII